mmetsp:Transcript_18949/g.71719  ORF Transcript_18949/g.71719 Transcript_18949/m.71719 type:complete len:215 (+) Transcript_18949:1794-2438(+)|eukprot:scaffold1954_cov268-Pinguiococcus_pyrenoidosus.AAC.304
MASASSAVFCCGSFLGSTLGLRLALRFVAELVVGVGAASSSLCCGALLMADLLTLVGILPSSRHRLRCEISTAWSSPSMASHWTSWAPPREDRFDDNAASSTSSALLTCCVGGEPGLATGVALRTSCGEADVATIAWTDFIDGRAPATANALPGSLALCCAVNVFCHSRTSSSQPAEGPLRVSDASCASLARANATTGPPPATTGRPARLGMGP